MNACAPLPEDQIITVAIASSLSNVMTEIKTEFNEKYPGVNLQFTQAASGILAQQIRQGAPIDIFASADIDQVKILAEQGKIKSQNIDIFAKNQLILAQRKDSKIRVKSLNDLRDRAIQKVAIGNPKTVPAGKYARYALERSPNFEDDKSLYQLLIDREKIVFAENVTQILGYLENRDVDVGFVYQTDVQQSPNLASVLPLDTAFTGEILYAIAPIVTSPSQAEAKSFINFILSDQGQTILQKYGFLTTRD